MGLFVTAVVGFYTIYDLWELFGDLKMPKVDPPFFRVNPSRSRKCDLRFLCLKLTFVAHFAARAVCLIVLPVLVFALTFAIHFAILTKSGPGDSTMGSLFQAHLEGNSFESHPRGSVSFLSSFFQENHKFPDKQKQQKSPTDQLSRCETMPMAVASFIRMFKRTPPEASSSR